MNLGTPLKVAVVTGLAFALTGCTGDDPTPPPSTSGTTQGSSTTSPTPKPTDQSALVFDATLPAVKASTTGTLKGTAATLNIGDVVAGPNGTTVTFWITGAPATINEMTGTFRWANYPTLVDTAGKKVMAPLLYTDSKGEPQCFCTSVSERRTTPQPRTVAYPPLDPSLKSIQVKLEGFPKPATVPIARQS